MKDDDNKTNYFVIVSNIVKCCFSNVEANKNMEISFSQLYHFVTKHKILRIDIIKGILPSNFFLQMLKLRIG